MQNKPILTPSYDNKIYQKYSRKTLKNKVENKIAFQEEQGLINDKKIPLLCVTIGLTSDKGGKLFEEAIEGILHLNVQIGIVAVGTEKYQKLVTQLADQHSKKIRIIPQNDENIRKLYAASDLALVFSSKDEDEEEIFHYLSYGVVPVAPKKVHKHLKLQDYNPVAESGNAFLYETEDKWLIFAALVRALENFVFPFDWQTIQINCMETVGEGEEE